MRPRFERRPLVLAALCCLAGSAAGSALSVPALLWGMGAVAAGLAVWWKRGMALMAALTLVFAMEAAALMQRPMPAPASGARLTGTVCREAEADEERTIVTLSDVRLNGEAIPWKMRVYAYEPVPAALGDALEMLADTWLPQGRVNPYGFDFDAWCRRAGVACATMKAGSLAVRPGASNAGALIRSARAKISEAIDGAFPAGQAPLVRALILGDRSDLDEDVTDDFRRAGIAHLLSLSGLHVTCLAMALDFLLRRLVSRRAAFFVMTPAMLAYAALVGFSGPIVRAVVMYLALRLAPLSGRPGDSLSGLAAAMLLMLAVNPLAAGDAGFILSFTAMAGLILLGGPVNRLLRAGSAPWPARPFLRAFTASLAASVALLPALANLFGAVQPYGPLVNLAAVPLATVALPLTFLALPVQMLLPAAGPAAAWPASQLLGWMTGLADFAAGLPHASIPVGHVPWGLCAVWAAGVYLVSDHAGLRRRLQAALCGIFPAALALSVAFHALMAPGGLTVDFLSVGDADAAVVHAQGQVYLVDAGEEDTAADYLAQTGSGLRAMFLTHPHDDHIGGAGAVQAMYPGVTVYVPECWARVPGVEAAAARTGLAGPFVPLAAGDEVALSGEVTARVLYPPAGLEPGDANDASLVLYITFGDGSALLTADLSDFSSLPDIPDVDLVKAPHHGADVKGAELLLRAATPGVVAVSASRASIGHPSGAFLERVSRLGLRAFRTDQSGMVRASIEPGGAVSVTTFIPLEAAQ